MDLYPAALYTLALGKQEWAVAVASGKSKRKAAAVEQPRVQKRERVVHFSRALPRDRKQRIAQTRLKAA